MDVAGLISLQIPASKQATEVAIALEQELIALHEARLRLLKEHLNAFAPINERLPPEILCHIFLITKYSNAPEEVQAIDAARRRLKPSEFYQYQRCVQVCRHWRQIGLQCAALWSDLLAIGSSQNVVEPTMLQCLLQRSGKQPLKLTLGHSLDVKAFKMVFKQLFRIEELEIGEVAHEVLLHMAIKFAPAGAPLLRRLTVTRKSLWEAIPSDDHAPALPNLQYLTYHNPNFSSFHSILHQKITCLHLHDWRPRQSVRPLLDALRKTPFLKDLTLTTQWEPREDFEEPPGDWPPVILNYLENLAICTTTDSQIWALLLANLEFPAKTTRVSYLGSSAYVSYSGDIVMSFKDLLTRFDYSSTSDTFDRLWPFAAMLQAHRSHGGPGGKYLTIDQLWGAEHVHNHTELISPRPPLYTLQLGCAHITPIFPDLLRSCFEMPSLGVRSLFYNRQYRDCRSWHRVVGHLINVETLLVDSFPYLPRSLAISESAPSNEAHPLDHTTTNDSEFTAANISRSAEPNLEFFPKLRTLLVYSTRRINDIWLKNLRNSLSTRARSGMSLERIVLVSRSEKFSWPAETKNLFMEASLDVEICTTRDQVVEALNGLCPETFIEAAQEYIWYL